MCKLSDLISDIRKSLNECKVAEGDDGCGCNSRYTDDDIASALNVAIRNVATLRPDSFSQDVELTIPAGECRVNICDAGCDVFIKYSHSKSDTCYFPEKASQDEIGKTDTSINPCFDYDSDAISPGTVYQWSYDPKDRCHIIVDRADIGIEVESVLVCGVYPEDYGIDDDLLDVICDKYRNIIHHAAIFYLIERDHRPTAEYLAYSTQHRDTAAIMMRDVNIADQYIHGCNFLGVNTDDCD